MKEFNLKEAKAGKPVCTRDGRHARIISFDRKDERYPIIALVEESEGGGENCSAYTLDGKYLTIRQEDCRDLMMVGRKKKGWINIYKNFSGEYYGGVVFEFKEQADNCSSQRIDCAEIEWEE